MKNVILFSLWTLMGCGAFSAWAEEGQDLATLQGLVQTWTDLRIEIAAEKERWQEQAHFLNQEKALLEKEIEVLEAEKAEFEAFSNSAAQEQAALLSEKTQLEEGLKQLEPLLDKMESALQKMNLELPLPLQLSFSFNPDGRVVDRVQSVATVLTQMETVFGRFHSVREVLTDGQGERREMDVLYVGQSIAFAVSINDDWAGVGTPIDAGWSWDSRPDWAEELRQLLAIVDGQSMAAFVKVPVQISSSMEEGQ